MYICIMYVRDENASAGGKLDEKRWYGILKRW